MRPGGAGSRKHMTVDDFQDQDAEPTSAAPGAARPQSRATPSEPGEPRTNLEAQAADSEPADKAADEDAELSD